MKHYSTVLPYILPSDSDEAAKAQHAHSIIMRNSNASRVSTFLGKLRQMESCEAKLLSQFIYFRNEFIEAATNSGAIIPLEFLEDNSGKVLNFVKQAAPLFILQLLATETDNTNLLRISLSLLIVTCVILRRKLPVVEESTSPGKRWTSILSDAMANWAAISLHEIADSGAVSVCIHIIVNTSVQDIHELALNFLAHLTAVSEVAADQMILMPNYYFEPVEEPSSSGTNSGTLRAGSTTANLMATSSKTVALMDTSSGLDQRKSNIPFLSRDKRGGSRGDESFNNMNVSKRSLCATSRVDEVNAEDSVVLTRPKKQSHASCMSFLLSTCALYRNRLVVMASCAEVIIACAHNEQLALEIAKSPTCYLPIAKSEDQKVKKHPSHREPTGKDTAGKSFHKIGGNGGGNNEKNQNLEGGRVSSYGILEWAGVKILLKWLYRMAQYKSSTDNTDHEWESVALSRRHQIELEHAHKHVLIAIDFLVIRSVDVARYVVSLPGSTELIRLSADMHHNKQAIQQFSQQCLDILTQCRQQLALEAAALAAMNNPYARVTSPIMQNKSNNNTLTVNLQSTRSEHTQASTSPTTAASATKAGKRATIIHRSHSPTLGEPSLVPRKQKPLVNVHLNPTISNSSISVSPTNTTARTQNTVSEEVVMLQLSNNATVTLRPSSSQGVELGKERRLTSLGNDLQYRRSSAQQMVKPGGGLSPSSVSSNAPMSISPLNNSNWNDSSSPSSSPSNVVMKNDDSSRDHSSFKLPMSTASKGDNVKSKPSFANEISNKATIGNDNPAALISQIKLVPSEDEMFNQRDNGDNQILFYNDSAQVGYLSCRNPSDHQRQQQQQQRVQFNGSSSSRPSSKVNSRGNSNRPQTAGSILQQFPAPPLLPSRIEADTVIATKRRAASKGAGSVSVASSEKELNYQSMLECIANKELSRLEKEGNLINGKHENMVARMRRDMNSYRIKRAGMSSSDGVHDRSLVSNSGPGRSSNNNNHDDDNNLQNNSTIASGSRIQETLSAYNMTRISYDGGGKHRMIPRSILSKSKINNMEIVQQTPHGVELNPALKNSFNWTELMPNRIETSLHGRIHRQNKLFEEGDDKDDGELDPNNIVLKNERVIANKDTQENEEQQFEGIGEAFFNESFGHVVVDSSSLPVDPDAVEVVPEIMESYAPHRSSDSVGPSLADIREHMIVSGSYDKRFQKKVQDNNEQSHHTGNPQQQGQQQGQQPVLQEVYMTGELPPAVNEELNDPGAYRKHQRISFLSDKQSKKNSQKAAVSKLLAAVPRESAMDTTSLELLLQ